MTRTVASKGAKLPDARKAAGNTAKLINANREAFFDASLGRVLRDAPWLDKRMVMDRIAAYHKEALSRIPPAAKYPEAAPWVEYVLTYEKELKRLTNLADSDMGVVMSLGNYLMFRGYKDGARPKLNRVEKCRNVFAPNTDQGPIWIKNVDDPPTYWKPEPRMPRRQPLAKWMWSKSCLVDGVGSGLHIDDEPDEIFPLPVVQMWGYYADDTPGMVQFMRRYSKYWGGANELIMDRQNRSMAVEKCSRNFMEVFKPDPKCGFSHVSGMACRDPKSPQGKYQKARRDEYRALYNLPDDGPDSAFWKFCDAGESMLVDRMRKLGPKPKFDDICKLFITPYPGGLCKGGYYCHPSLKGGEYTLATKASLIAKKRDLRWQRSRDCKVWPEKPEICDFT